MIYEALDERGARGFGPRAGLALRWNVVRFEHVWKEYRRGGTVIHALRDINLQVQRGRFCAILGPSGCGKSTLLNLIAGFDIPTEGDVILAGRSTRTFTDAEWTGVRRDLLGMVFQAFYLIPGLTVAENIALPLRLKGEPERVIRERVAEGLESVHLSHRAQHRPNELSGGEQQRTAIARALVHRPLLLLADEPTGNLDSKTAAETISLLRELQSRSGQTVILATHNHVAAQQADYTVVMKNGQLESFYKGDTL